MYAIVTYLALLTEGSTSKEKPLGEWRSVGSHEWTPNTPDRVTVTTRSGTAAARKERGSERGGEMKATGSRSDVSCGQGMTNEQAKMRRTGKRQKDEAFRGPAENTSTSGTCIRENGLDVTWAHQLTATTHLHYGEGADFVKVVRQVRAQLPSHALRQWQPLRVRLAQQLARRLAEVVDHALHRLALNGALEGIQVNRSLVAASRAKTRGAVTRRTVVIEAGTMQSQPQFNGSKENAECSYLQ